MSHTTSYMHILHHTNRYSDEIDIQVVSTTSISDKKQFDGTVVKTAEYVVGDSTGTVKVHVWDGKFKSISVISSHR